jgi:hypothetical protein
LNGLGWNRNASYFSFNLDGTWIEIDQSEDRIHTTNKMAFLGGEEGAALCIALLCTIVRRRRLSSKKRSTWAGKWLRRRRWDVFP